MAIESSTFIISIAKLAQTFVDVAISRPFFDPRLTGLVKFHRARPPPHALRNKWLPTSQSQDCAAFARLLLWVTTVSPARNYMVVSITTDTSWIAGPLRSGKALSQIGQLTSSGRTRA